MRNYMENWDRKTAHWKKCRASCMSLQCSWYVCSF